MTKRRQKGEGSITTLKNGKVRIRVEVDPVDGKRKWLSAIADTKAEAIKKLRDMQRLQEDTKKVEVYRTTFGDFVEPYLAARRDDGIKETSIQSIGSVLNDAAGFYGALPISKITPEHTNKLCLNWKERGNKDSTIDNKLNVVKFMFLWLQFKSLITSVPISSFRKKSKKVNTKANLEVLSLEEHQKLKELMSVYFNKFLRSKVWSMKYRYLPAYLLTYETGMREAEVTGLKWESIDFENSTVTVNNQTVVLKGQGVVDSTPKSYAGYRTIKISEATLEVFKQLKDRCEERHSHSPYVFANVNKQGKPYNPMVFLRILKDYLREVGIERNFTFHDLRHTNASLMFNNDVDVNIIKERLGHSSIAVTFKTYTHALPECCDKDRAVVTA